MISTTMKPLIQHHARWIDNFLLQAYRRSDDPEHQVEIARAALMNLTAWVSLQWSDAHVVEPDDGSVSS
jgi:hypothetical protein